MCFQSSLMLCAIPQGADYAERIHSCNIYLVFCFLHQQIISYSVKALKCGFFNRCALQSAGTNTRKTMVVGKEKCIGNNINTIKIKILIIYQTT